MIIDAHTHILKIEDVERLKKEMKEADVDKVIIMDWPNLPGSSQPPLEKFIGMASENMFFSVSINSSDVKNGLVRLEKFLQNKRVVGIKLYPGYDHFYPNEKKMFPIYEMAQKYNVPVLFHTGETWGEINRARLKFSRAVYIDDIAVLFPKVNFIMAHLAYPNFSEALEVIEKNSNVYGDISDILGYPDGRYAEKSFKWIKSEVERIIYTLGDAKKILYGTDWPFGEMSMKKYIERVKSLNIDEKDKELIFSKNALRIYERLNIN